MTDTAIHLPNSLDAPLVDPEFIANKHKDAFVAATEVLRQAQDWPTEVNGPADLEVLTVGVRSIMGAAKTLDAARDGEKRRFDAAAKEVQGLFRPRLDKLDAAKQAALGAITRHNRKVEEEQRRLAAEAAIRERAEMERRQAAAAALEAQGHDDVAETVMDTAVDAERMAAKLDRQATGSAADLVRTHTAGGTVTSATKLVHEVTDQAALRATLGKLADHFTLPEIDKAIRAYIAAEKRAGRQPDLAGVRFFTDSKAQVR